MADTETPAAQLREAAALLRGRAGAASPGRWSHMCLGSEGCQVLNDGYLRERKHVARFGRKEWKADHADAEFVASMGPHFALAVADWLEDRASEYEGLQGGYAEFLAGWCGGDEDKALAVARAYLGETDG
jgi:hypothetical protein